MIMGLFVIMKSAIDVDGPTHLIVSRQKDGDRVDEQSMSSVNRIGFVRLLSLSGSLLTAVCVLAAVVAGCTSPSVTGPRNEIASGSSSAEPSLPSGPRIVAGGPDSEDYGASRGYPIGDRSTFFHPPFLVGSHSHLDQIFEGRIVRRASTPSRLARAAAEPATPVRVRGQTRHARRLPRAQPTTGLLIARGDTILVERYQYARQRSASLHLVVDGQDRHRDADRHRDRRGPHPVGGRSRRGLRARARRHRVRAHVAPAPAADVLGRTLREEYSGRDDVTRLVADTFLQAGRGASRR